jgi:hypothetical protein
MLLPLLLLLSQLMLLPLAAAPDGGNFSLLLQLLQ